jgi:hypothetical protein
VRAVVLHHTASSNDYGPADVPALLRGFYAYHVRSRGWSDVGYNVLVDRFGTAWEGRAGGRLAAGDRRPRGRLQRRHRRRVDDRDVRHRGAEPGDARDGGAHRRLEDVGGGRRPARAACACRAPAAPASRPAPVVPLPDRPRPPAGQHDVVPGRLGVAALPSLRDRAAALSRGAAPATGALQLVVPSAVAGGRTADLLVRGGTPGATVDVWFAKRGEEAALRRRGGVLSAAGDYRTAFTVDDDWTVFATSGDRATPRAVVRRTPALTADPGSVPPSVQVGGPLTALAGTSVTVTATGRAGSAVSLWLRAEGDQHFVRRAEGRFDGAGRFSTGYTADRPHTYFARTAGAVSAEGGNRTRSRS